ncbi:hypothetical protein BCV70DRAFT_104620 [Testicularia cyperi]|uniref:RRM domain-containing protein n=1 Tax=Testicularia cyperi TaxID=1882483 RepID=A0A317XRV2_9BASI|nr:hypothetical protein BCV70DRAFT_104620 [Testicularia cyperi]
MLRHRSRSRSPVGPQPDGSGPSSHGDQAEKTAVLVENLSQNVQKPHLEQIFGWYGKVLDCHIPLHSQSAVNKGIAYINFGSAEHAVKAVLYMSNGQIDGRRIEIKTCAPLMDLSRRRSAQQSRHSDVEADDRRSSWDGRRSSDYDHDSFNRDQRNEDRRLGPGDWRPLRRDNGRDARQSRDRSSTSRHAPSIHPDRQHSIRHSQEEDRGRGVVYHDDNRRGAQGSHSQHTRRVWESRTRSRSPSPRRTPPGDFGGLTHSMSRRYGSRSPSRSPPSLGRGSRSRSTSRSRSPNRTVRRRSSGATRASPSY